MLRVRGFSNFGKKALLVRGNGFDDPTDTIGDTGVTLTRVGGTPMTSIKVVSLGHRLLVAKFDERVYTVRRQEDLLSGAVDDFSPATLDELEVTVTNSAGASERHKEEEA